MNKNNKTVKKCQKRTKKALFKWSEQPTEYVLSARSVSCIFAPTGTLEVEEKLWNAEICMSVFNLKNVEIQSLSSKM